MAIKLGDAFVMITGDNAPLKNVFGQSKGKTKSFVDDLSAMIRNSISTMLGTLARDVVQGSISMLKGLTAEALKETESYERLGLALENLIKRQENAVDQPARMSAEAAKAIADMEEKHSATVADILERAAERMADVNKNVAEINEEFAFDQEERKTRLNERLGELSERHVEREADILAQIDDADAQLTETRAMRAQALAERMAELAEQHAERVLSLNEQMESSNEAFEESRADKRAGLEDRLVNMRESAEEKIRRLQERSRKAETGDEQYELAKEMKVVQAALERDIEQQQAKATREEDLAQKKHDRQLAKLQARLQKEEEEYAKQQAKQNKRAAEEDAREQAKHDKRVVMLQARLKDEDDEYAKQQVKLQASFEHEEMLAKRSYDKRILGAREALAKIDADRKKALAEADKDYAKAQEDIREKFTPLELGLVSPKAIDRTKVEVKDLLRWIQKLAIESPFKQADVADAFRTAMAYGFTTKEAQRLTQAMLDFAAGSGASSDSMGRIALALGQIRAKGKLAGQEVLQLVNAGLPVTEILARAFGKTTAEIENMREKGLIPADEAIDAIVESLEKDFGGAAKAQAYTFAGLISTIEDIKSVGLREFFTGTFEAIKPYLTEFADFFSSEETMAAIRSFGDRAGQAIGGLLGRLRDAYSRDGINGVLTELGAMLREGWDTYVWPTLKGWATKAFEWVTGEEGAISQVPNFLGGLIESVATYVRDNWPTIKEKLNEWGTNFFSWVTEYAIPQAKLKLGELAQAARDWADSEEAQTKLESLGETLAKALIEGIKIAFVLLTALFEEAETWAPVLIALARGLGKAFSASAASIGKGFADGLIDSISQAIADKLGINKAMVESFLHGSMANMPSLNPGENIINAGGGVVSNLSDLWGQITGGGQNSQQNVTLYGAQFYGVSNPGDLMSQLQAMGLGQ